MKSIKAFTLVELLVVISIIALLLSILMPSLGKARKLAQRVVCASNQKQIVVAIETYASAYNGWYPVINEGVNWRIRLLLTRHRTGKVLMGPLFT